MSIDFRWVGPGILKEISDDIVIVHKPGALVTGHSLPDKRVAEFLKLGYAESYKVAADGQVISLTPEGNALPEATPVQTMSDAEQARIEEGFQQSHDDAIALQNLAKPMVPATAVAPALTSDPLNLGDAAGPKCSSPTTSNRGPWATSCSSSASARAAWEPSTVRRTRRCAPRTR